jgi:hypothetical protein
MNKITVHTNIPVDEGQKMLLAASLAQTAAIFYVKADITEEEAVGQAILMYAEALDQLEAAEPLESKQL